MSDSPTARLKRLAEALGRTRTLEAECVQTRRYLDPFSEIQERGKLLLKRPGNLRYSGDLFLPVAPGTWRKSGPVESEPVLTEFP